MLNSTTTPSVRILPNNKVYRQLFDAQVQLSDAYNRVRSNQLSRSVNITTQPESIPLVRNIRPHVAQKQKWLTSMSYSYDSNIDPISIAFHDERKRHQDEQKQELDELKREVYNLPDNIEYVENKKDEDSIDDANKGSITERLAINRQVKYNQLWKELLNKIAETNKNLLIELEKLTRQCNKYYEKGDKEIEERLKNLIYDKDITTLTLQSFENAFNQLDECLSPRLSQIQEYCQSIAELELERIHKTRDLFQYYSERLYQTHHLSEKDTACALEKQANELNSQIFDNRRVYTDLEAKLLTGETIRIHRFQNELANYQSKWKDAVWKIEKQNWISKLSACKQQLEPRILSQCKSIGLEISMRTNAFVEHINKIKSFVPPTSTRENVQKWYNQGYDIVHKIVAKRKELISEINEILDDEIEILHTESDSIREKVLKNKIFTEQQVQAAFAVDIEPLLDERQRLLQESIINRIQVAYEKLTNGMYEILDRVLAFIKPAAEQWDDHQIRLEQTTSQLLNLMQECRRPHDLQNEKKLVKLDTTLDEMRCASNETALSRLLNSSYDQLDNIKSTFAQFYEAEHNIVNKYSDMVNDEVNRYKDEILKYFRARQTDDEKKSHQRSSSTRQLHITSLSGTIYELEGYIKTETDVTLNVSPTTEDEQTEKSPSREKLPNTPKSLNDRLDQQDQDQIQTQTQTQTFLTETINFDIETPRNEVMDIPFSEAFQVPENLVETLTLNLCRAFLDHYDEWKEATVQNADIVMHSKHDELDKEMDFQMHLHEPRRIRIETDIHNVRAAEIVMHDERVERHLRGVQETLEQIDADYVRMLRTFSKSINTYKEDVFNLEEVFVNATTSNRLLALQDRLDKQRTKLMEDIRTSLRNFRQRFDDVMQYLRQANIKFRKSFKTFSEGGNFSREEIEIYRKKLEKTILQIDKAETMILHELEKVDKKQFDEATKIMNQFQERFKNHMSDLKFIELTNRWMSETQVKIKSEVAINNQNAQILKTLIGTYQVKIDSILNPNSDKPLATPNEVRELFHQIVLNTYERALYLKCLNNELAIPASIVNVLKDKGLIAEKQLVKDLLVTGTEDGSFSRRPSRLSAGVASNNEEAKSVKFASSSSPTTTSSRNKTDSSALINLTGGHPEDLDTITAIRSLLHQNDLADSDEIVEPGVPAALEIQANLMAADSLATRSVGKRSKDNDKSQSLTNLESSIEDLTPASRRERPSRARTRDEIYRLYCAFGERKHLEQDFLSKILNILRDSIEGLLTHSEIYYRDKGNRAVTRPQILRDKFDEFAHLLIEKLKNYEEQCRTYHESSLNEFRQMLELFERVSSLMPRIEFDEQKFQAEKVLLDLKEQFDIIIDEEINRSNSEKQKYFQQLRPAYGAPTKRSDLETINNQEKLRQENIQNKINEIRKITITNIQSNMQETIQSLAANAERLLILFDEILTADEITRTKLPIVKQSLTELIRRQQAGKPLQDAEPTPLIERKQGHWPGLPLLDDQLNRRRESIKSRNRSSIASQRQTSASIVTQKTTLPQLETIAHRDQTYQICRETFIKILAYVEEKYSTIVTDLNRDQTYWNSSIEKLQELRKI